VNRSPLARGRHYHKRLRGFAAVLAGLTPFDFYGPGLPARPTTALPGSKEKLRVLARRYARRQRLFHPGDARPPG